MLAGSTELLPLTERVTLIKGPPQCGKTSLLFDAAVQVAAKGGTVAYIAPQALTTKPSLRHDSLCAATLGNIAMHYLSTRKEVQKLLSTSPSVSLLVIDDITHYTPDLHSLIELTAVLTNTVNFLHSKDSSVKCIVSANESELAVLDNNVVSRLYPSVQTVSSCVSEDGSTYYRVGSVQYKLGERITLCNYAW